MEPFEKFSEWQDMSDSLKNYWRGKLSQKDHYRSIRIDGHQYWLYDAVTDGKAFLPFGGVSFYIQRTHSNRIEQVMLWDNADVPDFLKLYLPDNAKSMRAGLLYSMAYYKFINLDQAMRFENLVASKIGEWSPQLRGYMEAAKISSGDMLYDTLAQFVKDSGPEWDWA